MSKSARRELVLSLQPQYRQATWTEKQRLLDGLVAATGYDRKYAIALLNADAVVMPTAATRTRGRHYGDDIRDTLLIIWKTAGNCICSKRLIMILPVLIEKMEKFGHLQLSAEQRKKLLSLSAATIDRLLKPERRKLGRGRGTTKPGYLIKKQIPIRTYADWNDAKPGFVEADLVAHCGESVHGQFLNTLTVTDIATTWTETAALLRRSEADVMNALTEVRSILPFPVMGLDTDNGGEFINYTLLNWCREHNITFTRSREYKKNDQAHVEQKNGSVVRRLIGYDRYEGVESWQLLASLYRLYRLYVNYFQPSLKLDRKSRDGARVYRHYEKAQTPYERVLTSPSIPDDSKNRLRREFDLLDPVLLLTEIERLQIDFWRTAVSYAEETPANETEAPRGTVEPPPTNNVVQEAAATPVKPRRKRSDPVAPHQVPPVATTTRRGRKTELDQVWPEVCIALEADPSLGQAQVFELLQQRYPGRFRKTQISTIGQRISSWRQEHHPNRTWATVKPGRKTAIDQVWSEICAELENDPTLTVRGLMAMLCSRYPGRFRLTQRSTLVERVKEWRTAHIQKLSAKSGAQLVPLAPAENIQPPAGRLTCVAAKS